MRHQLTDAHIRLLRGIRSVISADPWFDGWLDGSAGPSLVIEAFASEPWASLTFSGMRHHLDLCLNGSPQQVEAAHIRLGQLLQEPELDLPGHFLAELQLVGSARDFHKDGHTGLAIHIEALTIEE